MIMNHSPLCKSFLIHGLLSFNLVKYLKTDWTDTGPIIIKLLAKSSFRFNSDLYGLIHVNSKCGPLWQPASQATVAASQQRGSHYSDKSRPASQPDTTPQRPQRSKEPATSQAASSHPASRQRTDCSLRKSAFSCTVWCTSQRLRALACFYRNILGFCVVGKISWLSCWEKACHRQRRFLSDAKRLPDSNRPCRDASCPAFWGYISLWICRFKIQTI